MSDRAWSTPDSLKMALTLRWASQSLLKEWLRGDLIFPYTLKLSRPKRNEISDRYPDVRAWVNALRGQADDYKIEWETLELRALGSQQFPKSVFFETAEQLFKSIHRQNEFAWFREAADATLAKWPAARNALACYPFQVLELSRRGDWPLVLAACEWFRSHPRPGTYLRQIDVPGVHTKFVEENKALLDELLRAILPAEHWDAGVPGLSDHGFERRFGLRYEEPLIRCRILDPHCAVEGLQDLSIPLSDFHRWRPRVDRVFITENKVNGIAFPAMPNALVIFGLGYGVLSLADIGWLREKSVYYWGDLDTHGFNMLALVRRNLPGVQSLLMDEVTLLDHRRLWTVEAQPIRIIENRLTEKERDVWVGLCTGRWGENIRLEQERLAFTAIQEAIRDWATK